MTYEEIRKSLETLTSEELRKLQARIGFMLLEKPTDRGESKYSIEAIFLLRASQHVEVVPLTVLEKQNPYQMGTMFRNAINQLINLGAELELNGREVIKLTIASVDAGNTKLEALEVGKTFRALLSCMSNVRLLLDDSFPGYIKAGLFKRLVLTPIVLP